MVLMGFIGRARSGKTSVANAIVDYAVGQGEFAKIYDLSGLILGHCIDTGLIPPKTRDQLTQEEIATLVRVGAEQRSQDENFWIQKIFVQIESEVPDLVIIPNIRYANEVGWIEDAAGITVRIARLNENGSEFISTDRDPNHCSENELHNYSADYNITVKEYDQILAEEMGITLYVYLRGLHERN